MESLQGADHLLACRVLHDRYSQCIKGSLLSDVLGGVDVGAPTRKCGGFFVDLQDHCGEHFRSGALVSPPPASAARMQK
jgi:hypothetical protein